MTRFRDGLTYLYSIEPRLPFGVPQKGNWADGSPTVLPVVGVPHDNRGDVPVGGLDGVLDGVLIVSFLSVYGVIVYVCDKE